MVTGGDSSPNSLRSSHTPELGKGLCTLNGRGIRAYSGVDIVHRSVGGDLALVGGARAGVVGSVGLDDVVFVKWACGPAVDGEIGVAIGRVSALDVDGSVL